MAKPKDIKTTAELDIGKHGDVDVKVRKGDDGRISVIYQWTHRDEVFEMSFTAEQYFKKCNEALRHIQLMERYG